MVLQHQRQSCQKTGKGKQEVKEDSESGWGLVLARGWEYKLDVKNVLHKLIARINLNQSIKLVILQTHADKIMSFLCRD